MHVHTAILICFVLQCLHRPDGKFAQDWMNSQYKTFSKHHCPRVTRTFGMNIIRRMHIRFRTALNHTPNTP